MKQKILLSIFTFLLTELFIIFIFGAMSKGEAAENSNQSPSPGTIVLYSKSTAPSGYLLCNGQAVSRTTYASLFAVIGTTYGSGDGSTTFNLPNIGGRTVIGNSSSYALASTGGSETHVHATKNHTLTVEEMPNHNHKIAFYNSAWTDTQTNYSDTVAWGAWSKTGVRYVHSLYQGAAGGYAGGGGAHNHGNTESGSSMQPYLALNYIIKY